MSCTCQKCNNKYKVDIMVLDEIWEQIKPENKPIGAGLLCGRCIIEELEIRGYSVWELKSLDQLERR
jgi:hypothetical protein